MLERHENKPPSAFIKDPETMAYLIERWRKYALTEGRSYGRMIGITDSKEVFDEKPDIDKNPRMWGVDGRYTLVHQQDRMLFQESAEQMHGVNFFNEIQAKIDEKKSKGDTKPVIILVTGSDLSFFNDELRSKFGNEVAVYGTTVELSRAKMRKRRFVEAIKTGRVTPTLIKPELQEYLATSLSDKLDPRDAKWRSILQMQSDKPEFDMIVDTCGELLYSEDENRSEIFEMTFMACITKLNPGGKLYIAEIRYERIKFVEEYCRKNNLTLEKNDYQTRHQNMEINFVITKPL